MKFYKNEAGFSFYWFKKKKSMIRPELQSVVDFCSNLCNSIYGMGEGERSEGVV